MWLSIFLVTLTFVFTAADEKMAELVREVSDQLTEDLVKAGKIDKATVEHALPTALAKVRVQLEALKGLGYSSDELARGVALRVSRDPRTLACLLPEELAPRAIGATIMGVSQIITDLVKMTLTRY